MHGLKLLVFMQYFKQVFLETIDHVVTLTVISKGFKVVGNGLCCFSVEFAKAFDKVPQSRLGERLEL